MGKLTKVERFRWWLWARIDRVGYLVCPDKSALLFVRAAGHVRARAEIDHRALEGEPE
jgi:hypothetical protein